MYCLELATVVWALSTAAVLCEITYDVQYVSQPSGCEGPLPTAELSMRSKTESDAGLFSEWSLHRHIAGNCTEIRTSSVIEPGMLYQFRVELSPAASCWCVMVTVNETNTNLSSKDFNCGTDQPNGLLLCARQDQTTSFLSMIVMTNFASQNCSAIPYSTDNSTDIAIAYQSIFEPLTCQNTCSTFPLIPVNETTEILTNITINFSMILKYDPLPTNSDEGCVNFNVANEGVLLKANSSNSTHYLYFYYYNEPAKNANRVPQPVFLDNQMVNLTYDGETFTVPSTYVNQTNLQNFSLDVTQLIKDEVVTISWEQYAYINNGQCDLWSLDNIFVIAKSETGSRTIFNDDFQKNTNAAGWTLAFSEIAYGSTFCSVENSYCIYFNRRRSQTTHRIARTRPIDLRPVKYLRPVTAVKPLSAPLAGFLQDNVTCQNGLMSLLLRFQLQFRNFQYPSVSTSSDPNTIVLSVSELGPRAHYAPVADSNWSFFNAAEKYFNYSTGNIPVYSPHPNQLTVATACVNVTDRETLEIVWRQDEFKSGFDHWYLHIDQVMLGDYNISNVTERPDSESYILSKSNDVDTNASICGFVADVKDVFNLTGNDPSVPRLVNLTLNITNIFPMPRSPNITSSFPKPITCSSDGIWNATTNCTVSNATSSFNNATFFTLESCEPVGRVRLSPDLIVESSKAYRLLQVCLFGHWSYVCDSFHQRDRNIVLNQLECSRDTDIKNFHMNSTLSSPSYVADVNCRGLERRLMDCRFGILRNVTSCEDGLVAIQANCIKTTGSCQNGELMKNSNNILYICAENSWMVLCPRWWTPAQATVACRQLHPNKIVIRGNITTAVRKTNDEYFQHNIYCSGEETNITDCSVHGINNMELGCPTPASTYAVGIVCETADAEEDMLMTCDTTSTPTWAWFVGCAIGAILSAVVLSTSFVIAILLKRKTIQHKMSNKALNDRDTIEIPNSNTVPQPLPYEDSQPSIPAKKQHNYHNSAMYDTASDDDIIDIVTSGRLEERNSATAAGAYSQLNQQ